MKNVFLIGNGFDLYHKLPTKYYDFMCVAEYLKNNNFKFPLAIGDIFSKCIDNENITQCYHVHKEVFDCITLDSKKACELSRLVQENIWFDYFLKTLNRDLGWIDFEKEIYMVINTLNDIIEDDESTVFIPERDPISPFVLSNFRFFIDIYEDAEISPMDDFDIKKQYLREYPYNSEIYVADKKKIFEELYEKLFDFSKALNLYFDCFIEATYDVLHKDDYINHHRINLLKLSDVAISFNYTNTLEKFYFNKKVYHIHGIIGNNIVLGVNPKESNETRTDDTALIKFKKYYQREVYGTDIEYINWYRETIGAGEEFRVVVIGHSLDITDKDIISDMFSNAKEIYISYYDDKCKDDYISNIVKLFGEKGWDEFRKNKRMEFVLLSTIEQLAEKIKPEEIFWSYIE